MDTDVAVSPDGKRLAFTTRSENRVIWSLPLDARSGKIKGDGQPLTNSVMALYPDLSPDGKKLVFVIQKSSVKWEMWEKSLDDGHDTLLIADADERWGPCWSRDGTRLAYRRRGKDNFGSIFLLKVGGSEQQITSLTDTPQTGFVFASDWSTDGEWILITASDSTGFRTLLRLVPVAAAPHAETEARTIASDPDRLLWNGRFSPNGHWITFNAVKEKGSSSIIYAMPAAGGEWIPITDGQYWGDGPRWSPDGKTIYYLSWRGGFFDVWGRRFDPAIGKPVGESFQVTAMDDPGRMICDNPGEFEFTLAANRLVTTIKEVSGSIWILDNVER
jgi:Tol biopolymer transport system component